MTELMIEERTPDHVPPELAVDWPLSNRAPTIEDPFDVLVPRIHQGPRAIYARHAHNMGHAAWVFRRAEDVRSLFMDPKRFSSFGNTQISWIFGEDWDLIPIEIDQPMHLRYRMLLQPLFTPSRMALLEDGVRHAARHFAGAFAERGECDFVTEFAEPFPVSVFLNMMGLPLEEMERFLQHEKDFMHNPSLDAKSRAMLAIKKVLEDAFAERRRKPGEDMLSMLLAAEIDGRKLTHPELMATGITFYLGGLDTVTATLGWMFRHLALHPDHQHALRERPGLVATGVEELTRAYAPVGTNRTAACDFEFAGVQIRRGDHVLASTPLTARDPEEYDRPNEIQLDRTHSRYLTFATGPHNCLGIHLARRELVAAVEEVLPRLRNFRIKPGTAVSWHLGAVLGLNSLPLIWDA